MTDPKAQLAAAVSRGPAFHVLADNGDTQVYLPLPRVLLDLMKTHIERDVSRMRPAIGDDGRTVAAQDTFATQRHLAEADELLADYARTFNAVRAHIKGLVAELLADAVGEENGVPLANLTVPSSDGDIRITRDITKTHTIAADMVLPAFAAFFADQHVDALVAMARDGQQLNGETVDDFRTRVATAITEAIADALASIGQVGKFEPQVSKVRKLAVDLARNGHDSAASVVAKSITTTDNYQGVKIDRKEPA